MENLAKTPLRIVQENECFSIPIYQRLFTWTPKEIKTLLDDINEQYKEKPAEHYYIGLLTSTHKNELVDGQQRFTVMMLMGIAMCDKYLEWKKFINNNGQPRLTFTARKEDEKYLLYKVYSEKVNCVEINPYMEAGISVIKNYIDNIKDAERFCKYIYEHLAFFIQKLPKGYSGRMLNKYFESMNSTGRNLENHEILKVELLDRAGITENREEYDRLITLWNRASRMNQTILNFYDEKTRTEYKNVISCIKNHQSDFSISVINEKYRSILEVISNPPTESKNTKGSVRKTLRSFLTFTDFLLQVLYISLKEKGITPKNLQKFFKPDNLRDTFKEFENNYDPIDFIETMFKYRVILDWAVIRIDGQGDYDLAITTNDNSRLMQYEAMLYASSSRDTYYLWVPYILSVVMNGTIEEEDILKELKDVDNSNHPFPEEHRFSYGCFENYYFRRLDYYLWEEMMNETFDVSKYFARKLSAEELKEFKSALSSYKFHQYNSVEHLHPQNEDNQIIKWQTTEGEQSGTSIHQFGNLALISSVFNSTQNNDSLNPKFGRIRDQITQKKLESIKLAIMYYEAGGRSEEWTSEIAKKHGQRMLEILKQTYYIIE